MTQVAVVGAGLVGVKRAAALHASGRARVAVVADADAARSRDFAERFGCEVAAGWRAAVRHPGIQAVVVATPNDSHAAITLAAIRAGKHVLCEKPLARRPAEALRMVRAAEARGVCLKTGFNHRHFPAMLEAKALLDAGAIGEAMYARCRYGHGGRPGYEHEWRAQAAISGGGELLDQGVHVLDLFRWFLGDIREVMGTVLAAHWPIAPLEDNAFALCRTAAGRVGMLHTSWTQWRNLFSWELFAQRGYLIVEGLGGSYGPQRLVIGRRTADSPVPREEVKEDPDPESSWRRECEAFLDAVATGRPPLGDGRDGLEAVRLVHALYRSARRGRAERVPPLGAPVEVP